jgi:hypothetical protein
MSQLADGRQIEEAGATFDGMSRPEDAVDHFLIDLRRVLFDAEKIGFNVRQMLTALCQIVLYQVVKIGFAHRRGLLIVRNTKVLMDAHGAEQVEISLEACVTANCPPALCMVL